MIASWFSLMSGELDSSGVDVTNCNYNNSTDLRIFIVLVFQYEEYCSVDATLPDATIGICVGSDCMDGKATDWRLRQPHSR